MCLAESSDSRDIAEESVSIRKAGRVVQAMRLRRYLQNSAEPLADARGSETRIDNKEPTEAVTERNGRAAEFCKYLFGVKSPKRQGLNPGIPDVPCRIKRQPGYCGRKRFRADAKPGV